MSRKTFAEAFMEGMTNGMRADPNIRVLGTGLLGHGSQRHKDKHYREEFKKRIRR